jgi:8-oxo-dGTP pyrophosphatase MutT (NUDIX family)
MKRVPRDLSVYLFRRRHAGAPFLMLRRSSDRGGFWQGVTGAPHLGERDMDAAIREVREETGFDVATTVFPLGVKYTYALQPERAAHWEHLYGAGIDSVLVVAFGAEVPDADPVLDPREHDAFAWYSYEQARALLDWPIEADALGGRRLALTMLNARLRNHP